MSKKYAENRLIVPNLSALLQRLFFLALLGCMQKAPSFSSITLIKL